ncbi:AlpA family phage regulatory protein [Variovorax sp. J22G73]|uniref:helix-turn-helix transcriptional regulator n=1 Tax=unclassified Variovorax TaxID=663243 RepID=UPI0025788DAA|nr:MULTISPECIES: AlpA family phage regulatory protein [unclassified Variovorax]MDM0007881.1 AlpA family phage regulatory protein [Variovorax sp. J22R203]MDM0100496.1 AlpA family phage regulatory protein [Variovorax sp. J22G73]
MENKRTQATAPTDRGIHPATLLRASAVEELTGLKRSALYARIAAGTFPRQIVLSSRCARWRAGEVFDWLEALK